MKRIIQRPIQNTKLYCTWLLFYQLKMCVNWPNFVKLTSVLAWSIFNSGKEEWKGRRIRNFHQNLKIPAPLLLLDSSLLFIDIVCLFQDLHLIIMRWNPFLNLNILFCSHTCKQKNSRRFFHRRQSMTSFLSSGDSLSHRKFKFWFPFHAIISVKSGTDTPTNLTDTHAYRLLSFPK